MEYEEKTVREAKRITVFTGHFGSGKTEVALNYALRLKEEGKRTAIVDFDVVNPYYRTKDAEPYLNSKGIRVIASPYANSNIENPAVPPEINAVFEDKDCYVILDVGGDDDGAIPLGSIHSRFEAEPYDMFLVLNERRIMTETEEQARQMLHVIEEVSRLKVTGLINNTHLKEFTTVQNVLDGQRLAESVGAAEGLPVVYTSGLPEILAQLPEGYEGKKFPLQLFLTLKF